MDELALQKEAKNIELEEQCNVLPGTCSKLEQDVIELRKGIISGHGEMHKLALQKEAKKVKLKEQYSVLQEACSNLCQKISEMLTTVTQLKEDLKKKEIEKKALLLSLKMLGEEDSLAKEHNFCDELLGQCKEKDSLTTKSEDKPSKLKQEMKEIEAEKKTADESGEVSELECSKKLIEIIEPGFHLMSTTKNGMSMIFYDPFFLEENEAKLHFNNLYSNINWYSKTIMVDGKEKPPSRMVAWFGPYPYSYFGSTLQPALMPYSVFCIKQKVESCLWKNNINAAFNSVILNLYRNNKDSVAWHSDDPVTTGFFSTIASVSLGETRKFELRPKRKCMENTIPCEKPHYFVQLMNGSLIVMDGCMQEDWQHRVPKEFDDLEARINLTFRTVYPLEKSYQKVLTNPCRKKQADTWNTQQTVSNSEISLGEEENNNSPSFVIDGSPSCSEKMADIGEASNPVESDIFKNSEILGDSETSFGENVKFENDAFNTGNIHDVDENVEKNSSECCSNYTTESLSNVTKSCVENKESPPKKSLNVLAKAFVPTKPLPIYTFSRFTLEELLCCEVNLLYDYALMDFAHNLKIKVTERLHEFLRFDRQELEFLCMLIDRSQTEKNQKLITSRIIKIVLNNLERPQLPSNAQKYYNVPSYRKHYRGNRFYYNQSGNAHKY